MTSRPQEIRSREGQTGDGKAHVLHRSSIPLFHRRARTGGDGKRDYVKQTQFAPSRARQTNPIRWTPGAKQSQSAVGAMDVKYPSKKRLRVKLWITLAEKQSQFLQNKANRGGSRRESLLSRPLDGGRIGRSCPASPGGIGPFRRRRDGSGPSPVRFSNGAAFCVRMAQYLRSRQRSPWPPDDAWASIAWRSTWARVGAAKSGRRRTAWRTFPWP